MFHFKFYAIDEGKSLDLKDMGTYTNKETNEVLWSSNGVIKKLYVIRVDLLRLRQQPEGFT